MMHRRTFLRNFLGWGAVAYTIPLWAQQQNTADRSSEDTTITFLSTNDVHSHIDPFPANAGAMAGRGGFARRAWMIDAIRKEAEHTVLLDAGDIFQGTPYFNLYKGELELKLMSEMSYDAATIGNHEFDNGMENIVQQLSHAQFDFVCANYDFSHTPLEGKIKPYTILTRGKIRIGVFGLGVALEGLVEKRLYGATKYYHPVEIAQDAVKTLNEAHCDIIVCLSHIGYHYPKEPKRVCDIILAQETEGIDLIIGGHTHTFLDQPQVLMNRQGKPVIVSQLGWGGVLLGRIDISLPSYGRPKTFTYRSYDVRGVQEV